MKRSQIKNLMLTAFSAAFVLSCTDLEIEGTDSIISTDSGTQF